MSVARRQLIAGAAAVAAGILARASTAPERVAATSGTGTSGNLVMGSDGLNGAMVNTSGTNTVIRASSIAAGNLQFAYSGNSVFEAQANFLTAAEISVNNGYVDGLRGTAAGSGSGVYGTGGSNGGAGILGVGGGKGTASSSGIGVVGVAAGASNPPPSSSAGVYGTGRGAGAIGVRADSDSGVALSATSDSADAISAQTTGVAGAGVRAGGPIYGVYGVATATGLGASDTTYGVSGIANGGPNRIGVYGKSNSGTGVYGYATSSGTGMYGTSTTGIGVYGVHSDASGSGSPYGVVGSVTGVGIGIYGVVTTAGAVAFAGGAGVAGAIAAQFSGPVNIFHTSTAIANGNLYIQGNYTAGGTKSAAVPHPDGTHRLVYCVEAPESWLEDFGTGTLSGGKAEVKLDPDFAAIIDAKEVHVFLTPHDETHHLAVKATSSTGFSVAADVAGLTTRGIKAADVNGTFSYRVVARRKDVPAPRLAKFTVPAAIKTPAPAVPPAPKEPPKR